MFENANKHFRKEDVVTPCGMSSGYFININLQHFYWQLLFLNQLLHADSLATKKVRNRMGSIRFKDSVCSRILSCIYMNGAIS